MKYKNYARYGSYDNYRNDEDDNISGTITPEDMDKNKKAVILGMPGAIKELLGSKMRVMDAASDEGFLKKLDEKYPGKNYSKLISTNAEIYSAEDDPSEKLSAETAKKLSSIDSRKKFLGALAGGFESPGKELLEAILEAFTQRSIIKTKLNTAKKLEKLDSTNIKLDPNMAEVIASNTTEEQRADAGISKEDEKDLATLKPNSSDNSPSNIFDANIDMKVTDDATLFKLGEVLAKKVHKENYDENILRDIIKNAKEKIGKDNWDALASYLRNIYKSALVIDKKFSIKNKVLSCFTIVKSYNLFSKISEFVSERFPSNFSKIMDNKIVLNDGRYLTTKIVSKENFSVTIHNENGKKENSIELPLKVHKFKWHNSINDNLINKG